uniref:hypothetical protein n=1 Tax=Gelidibacter sp. TaxID=2018083 RepID=UPI00404B33BC
MLGQKNETIYNIESGKIKMEDKTPINSLFIFYSIEHTDFLKILEKEFKVSPTKQVDENNIEVYVFNDVIYKKLSKQKISINLNLSHINDIPDNPFDGVKFYFNNKLEDVPEHQTSLYILDSKQKDVLENKKTKEKLIKKIIYLIKNN